MKRAVKVQGVSGGDLRSGGDIRLEARGVRGAFPLVIIVEGSCI